MKRTAIERLFRKELRELRFDPSREVFLVKTGTVEEKAVRSLLAHVFGGRVTVTPVAKTTRKRQNLFIPSSLENELVQGLWSFLEGEQRERSFTPLLGSVPEDLIVSYATANAIAGRTLAPHDDVRALLEGLQRLQPQTKAALRRSFAHLRASSATRAKSL